MYICMYIHIGATPADGSCTWQQMRVIKTIDARKYTDSQKSARYSDHNAKGQ